MSKKITLKAGERLAATIIGRLQLRRGEKATIVGSIRRRKPLLKDVDIMVNIPIAEAALRLELPGEFNADRRFVQFQYNGIAIDIFYVRAAEYPYALLHYTGSYKFNIYLRIAAKRRGYRLNQHGIWIEGTDRRAPYTLNLRTERQVMAFLEYPYKSPTDRSIA